GYGLSVLTGGLAAPAQPALSIAGEQFGRKVVGRQLGKAAVKHNVKAEKVLKGATGGAVAGGLGLAALAGIGLATAGVGLLAIGAGALIAGGVGAASGWTAGGWGAIASEANLGTNAGPRAVKAQISGPRGSHRQPADIQTPDPADHMSGGEKKPRSLRRKEREREKSVIDRKLEAVKEYLFGSGKLQEKEEDARVQKGKDVQNKEQERKNLLERVWGSFKGLVGSVFGSDRQKTMPGGYRKGTATDPFGQQRDPKVKRLMARNAASQRELIKAVGLPTETRGRGSYKPDVSKEFRNKAKKISKDLGIKQSHLMAVMGFETGGTYSADVRNKAGSGATGLIQFMPETAQGLGVSTSKLAKMSPTEQLDYVKKYYNRYDEQIQKAGGDIEDVYMAVLSPAYIGKKESAVWGKSGSDKYRQNRGLDLNNDGTITVGEATTPVQKYLPKRKTVDKTKDLKSGQFSMKDVWSVVKQDVQTYKEVYNKAGLDQKAERMEKALKGMGQGEYFGEGAQRRVINQLKNAGATK
ncbi:MAG: hypothetical protein ABEK59_02120, partial [Halobacteria archaeon]